MLKENAFIVGVVGDIALQAIVESRGDLVGLKPYFEKHGRAESVTIAGGVMYGTTYLFQQTGFAETDFNLFVFGGVIDLMFRYGNIYPTLKPYYKALSVPESIFWAGFPLIVARHLS